MGLTTFTFSFLSLLLFLGMLACIDVGRRIGRRFREREGADAASGTSSVEGAVLALLGLLLAFTFSGASQRFDARRALIIEEANDIGTAWLRIDLVEAADQPALRQRFRDYVDARLAVYRSNGQPIEPLLARVSSLQADIWRLSVDATSRSPRSQASMLLLPALNAMFDITTTRTAATEMHPPTVVFSMLYAVALVSALFAGFSMASARDRSWLHAIGFTLAMSVSFYVIIDMEYPRLGEIRVDAFDRYLVDVRETMR